jgi:ketosteroid isomerase-like protein
MQRTTILAALIPLMVVGGCDSATKHPNAREAIIALERGALDRWSKGDPLGYVANAAEDITYFDDIGAQSRIDGLEAMRTYLTSLQGKITPHTYEIASPEVQVYGDIGILTFQYHPSTMEGTPLTHWKATSVYRYSEGKWRAVHAHWSIVKES